MANYLLAKYADVVNLNPQFQYRRRTPDGRVVLSLRDGNGISGIDVELVNETQLNAILNGGGIETNQLKM